MSQVLAHVRGNPVYARVCRLSTGEMECVPEILTYIHRPAQLEDVDLYTFSSSYELVALPKGRGRASNVVDRGAAPSAGASAVNQEGCSEACSCPYPIGG